MVAKFCVEHKKRLKEKVGKIPTKETLSNSIDVLDNIALQVIHANNKFYNTTIVQGGTKTIVHEKIIIPNVNNGCTLYDVGKKGIDTKIL